MKPENIVYALMFVAAMGAPFSQQEIVENSREAEIEQIFGALTTFRNEEKEFFYLAGNSEKKEQKQIYVCPDGRLTYGKIVEDSRKFKGSVINGFLIGKSAGNGYQPVGFQGTYFAVGFQNPNRFQISAQSSKKALVGQGVSYYCDSDGFIHKGIPVNCDGCQTIDFECTNFKKVSPSNTPRVRRRKVKRTDLDRRSSSDSSNSDYGYHDSSSDSDSGKRKPTDPDYC